MVRPKKHLGQHFLRDENIARNIVEYLTGDIPTVVEVGAGTGVLSKYLLQDPRLDPYFFEIDEESISFLKKKYPDIESRLITEDFLGYDLSKIKSPFVVMGNFPYNISSQILFRILDYRNEVPFVIGMFQKEVAERIASPPGSKKYGILSVLLQAFYEIDYLFTVNENVFTPPPKVKSAVIRLRRNAVSRLDCDEALFKNIVKTGFNQRRKTLRNSLKVFHLKEDQKVSTLLDKRAEQLSVQDFVFLTNSVNS